MTRLLWVTATCLVLSSQASAESGPGAGANRLTAGADFAGAVTSGVYAGSADVCLEGWGYGPVGARFQVGIGYLAFQGEMPEGNEPADHVAGHVSVGAVLRWNHIPAFRRALSLPVELRTSVDSQVIASEPLVGVGLSLGLGVLWPMGRSLGLSVEARVGWLQMITESTNPEAGSGVLVGANVGLAYLWF